MEIERISVSEQTYRLLKEGIITGIFPPGKRLLEGELTEKLKVSRTPLREAISKLEIEGLVYRHISGGASVTELSVNHMKQIYSVRVVLEGLAVREAAEKITDEEIKRFEQISRQIAYFTEKNANEEVAKLGSQFHHLIYEVSGNQICFDMLKMLANHIDRYRRVAIAIPGRKHNAYREHIQIISLLSKREGVDAEECMKEHILNASKILEEKLSKVLK